MKAFRTILTALSALGAVGFTGAYLYGIAYTPDMVRNFLATDAREALGYCSLRTLCIFFCSWLPLLWLSLNFAPRPRASLSFADCVDLKALLHAVKRVFVVLLLKMEQGRVAAADDQGVDRGIWGERFDVDARIDLSEGTDDPLHQHPVSR